MKRHAAAILVATITFAVFLPTVRYEFVRWDDNFNIYENPELNPVTASGILQFWTRPMAHYMHPLTYTMWAGEALIAGRTADGRLKPAVFHLGNVLLHTLCALLVFKLLCLMFQARQSHSDPRPVLRSQESRACPGSREARPTRGDGEGGSSILNPQLPAAAGALLFALHPVQVEPVAWVTGGRDVLSGAFSLLALLLFLRHLCPMRSKQPPGPGHASYAWLAASTVAFTLSITAKPTSVVLPLVAAALGLSVPLNNTAGGWRARLLRLRGLLLWLIPALPWAVFTKYYQRDALIVFVPPLWARPFIALDAVAFYLCKLVVPFPLGPEYGRSPAWLMQTNWLWTSWLVPVLLLVLLVLRRHGLSRYLIAAAVFLAGLLPVSGLIPFRYQGYSTVADRYLYLSMLGPALACACLLHARRARKSARRVLCAALVLLCVRTLCQMRIWRDDITLFTHALQVNARSYVAHHNLGESLEERGAVGQAIEHLKRAIELRNDFTPARVKLGTVLVGQGRLDEARKCFSAAIRLEPGAVDAHVNLGIAAASQGDLAGATNALADALAIDPDLAGAHYNLAVALRMLGRTDAAIEHYRDTVRLETGHRDARNNLGILLAEQGRLAEAVSQYSAVLAAFPADAEVHYNLALALERQGRRRAALWHLRRAVQIRPRFQPARQRLRAWAGE